MTSHALIALWLLGQAPSVSTSPAPAPGVLEAYRDVASRAGSGPDEQVKLALWCDARGLAAQRSEHVARALEADPGHTLARALAGFVGEGDGWLRAEDAPDRLRDDAKLAANLAQYNARRAAVPPKAESHFKLARWCDMVGLKPEAEAHLVTATRIDPDFGAAWARLGYRKYQGRWMTKEQIDAFNDATLARRAADRRWRPQLRLWKDWLDRPDRRDEAEKRLRSIADPGAVPSIKHHFFTAQSGHQSLAAEMLGSLDDPQATGALVLLAAYSSFGPVRDSAVKRLRDRDPREVIDPLIGYLQDGLKYSRVAGGLLIEGDEVNIRREYTQVLVGRAGRDDDGGRRRGPTAEELIQGDIGRIEANNKQIQTLNSYALEVLRAYTGENLGADPAAWRAWWADEQGYTYTPKPPPSRTIVQRVAVPTFFSHSCFAAGTPVTTFAGRRPIEALRVGDRVLAQDPASGALHFRPIVAVYHNRPNATLRIRVGGEAIVATPIHRFWRVGEGWVMARELRAGDRIRTAGGTASVDSVKADLVQPVYNLEVSGDHSFFVGATAALVHDHSLVAPRSEAFDSPRDRPQGARESTGAE